MRPLPGPSQDSVTFPRAVSETHVPASHSREATRAVWARRGSSQTAAIASRARNRAGMCGLVWM
jgi:hypothetical protein